MSVSHTERKEVSEFSDSEVYFTVDYLMMTCRIKGSLMRTTLASFYEVLEEMRLDGFRITPTPSTPALMIREGASTNNILVILNAEYLKLSPGCPGVGKIYLKRSRS